MKMFPNKNDAKVWWWNDKVYVVEEKDNEVKSKEATINIFLVII